MSKLKLELENAARQAHRSAAQLAGLCAREKNNMLRQMASALIKNSSFILQENARDLAQAEKAGLSSAFIERLTLNKQRIKLMADSLRRIAGLKDPLGEVIRSWQAPSGLRIRKVRVPIGVIAVIYESRPNVTSDCIGLCLKAGNSLILRGGSESLNSNIAIYKVLKRVFSAHKVNGGALYLVTAAARQAIDILLRLDGYIDLVMPRGGEALIRKVAASSRIPVIKHYKGICHIFVDECVDLNMAERVCFNAKVERPGVCNAMECMLVHRDIAGRFLPGMLKKFKDAGVQIRGCDTTRRIGGPGVVKAKEQDYYTEYLDLILSVKVVDGLEQAIQHINKYGSGHSDAIITGNRANARKFLNKVDSACVYVNASTRFTDGGQFGMGAEIGISTDKLHARGPVALEELTTYKYVVLGHGQIRR